MHYHARFFPVGPLVVVFICVFIILCSNLAAARAGDWGTVLISYMSVVMFAVLYVLYKIVKKSKIVPYATMFDGLDIHKLDEDDVSTGRVSPVPLLASTGPM
jgi:lysine-specific permease